MVHAAKYSFELYWDIQCLSSQVKTNTSYRPETANTVAMFAIITDSLYKYIHE